MLRWSVVFLMITIVSAIFGFTGTASVAGVAKAAFYISGFLFLLFLGLGVSLERHQRPTVQR